MKQIGPTGARQRTKAALLLIDCRISPIFPGGTVARQWQMEADWTPEQGEGKKKRLAKPAVKLAAMVGHNTATRSLFNRTRPSTEERKWGTGGLKQVKRGSWVPV